MALAVSLSAATSLRLFLNMAFSRRAN